VGIEGGIDVAATHVRADRKRHGAMTVDVIDAVLRIVLDHEDRHFFPERRLGERLDDWPSARSLSATIDFGVCTPGDVPRVIARQLEKHKVRHPAGTLPFLEFGEKQARPTTSGISVE
jgi:hypothetical protein